MIQAARLFLVGALGVTGFLAWVSLSGAAVPGCGPASGCDRVLASRWATAFGLPVSLLALPVQAALLAVTFCLRGQVGQERERTRFVATALAVCLVGAAVWFTALQLAALKTVCLLCTTAHALGTTAALLICFARHQTTQSPTAPLPRRSTLAASALGVAAVAALIAVQVFTEPPGSPVKSLGDRGLVLSGSGTDRRMMLHAGAFAFPLNELPILGPPEAPRVALCLFDYTCPQCRAMHGRLVEAQRKFQPRLAIAFLPVPLEGRCNPIVRETLPLHAGACEYARLGLAVWRCDSAKFEPFNLRLLQSKRPPALNLARQFAEELTNPKALSEALADGWADRRIQDAVSLFARNHQTLHVEELPQVILGDSVLLGEVERQEELERWIEKQLRR
jgi:uncharacterized membrane protein